MARSRSRSPRVRRRSPSRSRSPPRDHSSSSRRRESGRSSRWAPRTRSPPRRHDTSTALSSGDPRNDTHSTATRRNEPQQERNASSTNRSSHYGSRGGRSGGRGGGGRRRSRSLSPPPTHDGAKTAKKAKDFSHLVQWGKQDDDNDNDAAANDPNNPPAPVEKPNFGLSGALAKDQTTGNVQNGVVMKWSEPPEARAPTRRYRLYVFKGDDVISTLHVHRKSAFLIGRDKTIADILTEHASCSKQHAVLQYRLFQTPSADGLRMENDVRPYILDLDSTNGTLLNGKRVASARYVELRVKDVLQFGESTREYVLMDASA